MLIEESLHPEAIIISDGAENAEDVVGRLCEQLAGVLNVDRGAIERAVLAREQTRTTALANGTAIPHCRLPGLNRFGIAVMLLRQPIPWDSEGHQASVVIMIVGPADNVAGHLRIMANCSHLLDSPALQAKLATAPDAESAHALILAAEAAIEDRRNQHGMLREVRKDQENGVDHLKEVADGCTW